MNKIAIVTGAESGIGKATVLAFATAGYDVGMTWRNSADSIQACADAIMQCGRSVAVRRLDMASPDDCSTVIESLAQQLGGVDVLVNNAATAFSSAFIDTSPDEWRKVLDVNLTGPFCCSQSAVRLMIAGGSSGSIVNVTSIQDTFPVSGSSAYGAAKGGLRQLTRVMALELGKRRIRVNAVAPGEINTAMNGREGVCGEEVPRIKIPLGRAGSAHEAARAVLWVASDAASYVTGATIVVDGGSWLMGPELCAEN